MLVGCFSKGTPSKDEGTKNTPAKETTISKVGLGHITSNKDEIKAMKVKKRDENHPSVPDVEELTSLVTVSVEDYIAAVVESNQNAK